MYQITDQCVCCHNCALECPRSAINYLGGHYQINQDLCIQCGLCARQCHISAIIDTDAEPVVEQHERMERTCDVVVCGGGTGLVAAVKAAQQGKKVILLEKAKKLGGNTDFACAIFPVYSKWHEELGYPDVREEAIDYFERNAEYELDRDVIRTAVYRVGDFFDWMLDFDAKSVKDAFVLVGRDTTRSSGPMYGPAKVTFGPERYKENILCRDAAIGPGKSGTFIKYEMLRMIQEQKLDVEILTEHAARHLILDPDGSVKGVIASDPGGETVIHAGAVILSTGGMGKSDEKLAKYFDFFNCETKIHRFSVPTDTGDAIDMLEEIGVKPDPNRLFCSIFGPAHHPYSYCLYRIMEHPSCVSINLNGKRWQNEMKGLEGGRFLFAKQPKEIAWGIFSQENIDAVGRELLENPIYWKERWMYETYQEELEEEIRLPDRPVRRADTIEELAELIGADPDAMAESIAEYNRMCEAGEDTQFGKDAKFLWPLKNGPYYAIYGQRFSEGAFGGLMVNSRCEVLRNDGKVIPGLYGTGDATSAMHRRGKLAVISELTWACASAYEAGVNAAEYAGGAGC